MTKGKLLSIALALLTLSAVGCINDVTTGGPVTTRNYDITGFTAVKIVSSDTGVQVYHRFIVEVVPSERFSISVTANDNLFSYIHVTRSGETLEVELRDVQVSFGPATLEAMIAMPQLSQLRASGAADVSARGFKSSSDFKLTLSGGANAELDVETGAFAAIVQSGRVRGSIRSADAHFEAYGTSTIVELRGSGNDLTLRCGDGSETTLVGFPVRNADVVLMGQWATRASLTLDGQLDVTLGNATSLSYSGNATLGRTTIAPGATLRQKP